MKTSAVILLTLMMLSSQMVTGQRNNEFLDMYQFNRHFGNPPEKSSDAYRDMEGSPYLNREFVDGIIYLKDTTAVKLQLRYNLYTDDMEYLVNGATYIVGDPRIVSRIVIGNQVFMYMPFVAEGKYVELLESGTCLLVEKRTVQFKPEEGPKPVEGTIKPARFIPEPEDYYLVFSESKVIRITSMKSLIRSFQDKQVNVENYIRNEKINKLTRENLIRIVAYYNTLTK